MMKPIQITIDEEMLKLLDAHPEARKDGRSAFIRRAIRHYLKSKREEAIDAAYRKAYSGGVTDPDLALWEKEQVWPPE